MSLVTIYDSGTAGTLLSDDFTPKTLSLNIRDAKQEDSYSENPDIVISGEDADADDENTRSKKKKRYHRHTPLQIQELEALFKECPHPDEKQRTELSRRLNLETRQVKFWFQNRRTQMKTQLERHENAILKQENDKLRMENMAIRSALQSPVCRNCGGVAAFDQEQLLRIENANLKEELDRVGKFIARPTFVAPDSGFLMEMAVAAMDEFVKMAEMGEPLWVREFGVGREVLDFDEYRRIFPRGGGLREVGFVAEATRETGMVIVNSDVLVKTLIDATRWTDMFPGIIARAMTTDVISDGIGGTRNGLLQLMHAELQVLSPLVPVREVEFLRFCKLLQDGVWAVVDVSIDSIRENSLESGVRCRRLPSGILVQDMPNGYSKVTWVEHTEYDEMAVHELCRPLIRSGMGFGAKRWLATLQRRCECLAKILASNAARNNLAVTASGLKSMLKLAQRMMDNFCAGACTSSVQKWSKLSIGNIGKDIRMMSRQSLDNPGEPPGVVLSASTAVWLPVSPQRIFNFLRDETHRNKWDILSCGGPMQEIARIAKGEEDGNAVSLLQASSNAINAAIGTRSNGNMLILQETCTDASGCMVVYAPVDIPAMQLVMNGGDSAYVALLPSGFAILPDGQNTCGALLTVAFQILVNNLPSSKLTVESVETVNNLISCTVQKIKSALGCDS